MSAERLLAYVDLLAFPRHYVAEHEANVHARDLLPRLLRGLGYAPVLQGAYDIGLPEGTAIIVRRDWFEVMGAWKVAVHDNTRLSQPWEKHYYVLSAGDVYNMKTRRVEKLGTGRIMRRQERRVRPAAGFPGTARD